MKTVPANLPPTMFDANGKLTLVNNYGVDTGNAQRFWSCMVALG